VDAVVDDADQGEEHPGDQAVVEHLDHAGLDALRRERAEREQREAHVADRRVRDQLLEVLLRHRAERAVEDVDHAEHGHRARGPLRGLGQERHVDAHDAVGAHLEEHAGEDDADRGGSLDVGVGQPRVEREHRDLDREPDEQPHPHQLHRGEAEDREALAAHATRMSSGIENVRVTPGRR
jgi:hypothetical protein